MKYLVGIDNGGTFSKAALFDSNGNQVSVYSVPTMITAQKPGYAQRDMDELWEMNARAVKNCLIQSGIDVTDIAGVSICGHGKGLYMVDYDGKPSDYGILSTDTRAWEYALQWMSDGTYEKIYNKTYQNILACQPVSLLAWYKDHKPEILNKTKYLFHVKDYIRYKLTGEAYAEYTDSTGGNLVNLNTQSYDKELLDCFGLGVVYDKLPPLKNSSDICGYVTEEASKITGLPAGIPVAAGMFDVDACGLASGLVSDDMMCMIAGTWSINEFIAKIPVKNKMVALNSMYCIPGYYLVEESSPTSAGNLEWFITQLLDLEKNREGKNIYDLTNKWVSSVLPEDSNVIFLPYLNGSADDALAAGTFTGLLSCHNKKHILRAIYEGIAFSHRSHVEKLLESHPVPDSIRLAGGASNSDVWISIFADILQIPIDVIENKELGAQGAAMAAGIAAGIYKDYEDAVGKTVRISKTVMPRKEYKAIYERKYKLYQSVALALKNTWKQFGINEGN